MALPSVDMSVCTPKNKCLSGPNEGLLYNRDNPCSFGADFDPLKCDCVPWLASDEVQYRITSGTGILVRGGGRCGTQIPLDLCDPPSEWVLAAGGPNYDAGGNLIQTAASFVLNAGCNFDNILETDQCNPLRTDPFPTSIYARKVANCGGGGTDMFSHGFIQYRNGEFWRTTGYAVVAVTDNGTWCSTNYPVGFEWTLNIEYRTSDGQGGWLPGIQ